MLVKAVDVKFYIFATTWWTVDIVQIMNSRQKRKINFGTELTGHIDCTFTPRKTKKQTNCL